MEKWLKKATFSEESISAIFIITLLSAYILSKFFIGFSLFIYLGAIILSAIITFCYPRSGVYAIIFLTFVFERFFTLDPIIWGRSEIKLYPLDILMVGVMASIGYHYLKNKLFQTNSFDLENINFRRSDGWLLIFMLLASIVFALSLGAWHGDKSLAFSSLKAYAFYPIWYFIILGLFSRPSHQKRLMKFALAGVVAIIFFVLFGLINGGGLWTEYTPLSTQGVRTLAFTHAFYLSLTWIMALPFIMESQNKKEKNIWLIISLIWFVGIVGSLMRHLWLALVFVLAILWLFHKEKRKILNQYLLKISIGIFIGLILLFYLSELFLYSPLNVFTHSLINVVADRAGSLTNGISQDESFVWRQEMWKIGIKEYLKSPIIGIGFGRFFAIEMGSYHNLVEARDVHNSILLMIIQMGLLGLGVLLVLIKNLVWLLIREIKFDSMNLSLLLGLTFYLIASSFQPYWEANMLGIFFWMILGLIRARNL